MSKTLLLLQVLAAVDQLKELTMSAIDTLKQSVAGLDAKVDALAAQNDKLIEQRQADRDALAKVSADLAALREQGASGEQLADVQKDVDAIVADIDAQAAENAAALGTGEGTSTTGDAGSTGGAAAEQADGASPQA